MNAALLRARTEFRARFPSMLALALLLGLASGVVLTLTAGARRTDSAYGRFARRYKAADMLIYPAFDSSFASLDFDEVARLPEVAASARYNFVGASNQAYEVIAGDADAGRTVDRVKVLEGRLPHPDSLDEAALSFPFVRARHLHVGDTLPVTFGLVEPYGKQIIVRFRIIGIVAAPGEFPPQISNSNTPGEGAVVRIAPALFESLKQRKAFTLQFMLLRFRGGHADFEAVNDRLSALAKGKPQLNQNLGAQAANVQRSIHLQAVALRIVGGLVALIGLLVLSQLVARQAALDAAETPVLLALGMMRREIALSGLGRSVVIGMAGAFISVGGAFAASPLMPIGTARVAEPHNGLSFDAPVLGLGALTTVAVFVAMAAWPLWKSSKADVGETAGSAKPSLAARSATAAGFPPSVSTGMRLALETGGGRTTVPVRSSLFSVALAIVALASALTFGAGLDHLLQSPRQYGWNWDAFATDMGPQTDPVAALKAIDSDPSVAAASFVDTPPIRVGGATFDAIAFKQHKGVIKPVVIDGREPRGANEIALGVKTLRDIRAHIGSTVHASITAIEGGGASFTVVGTVVIPPNSDTARLGSGGVITYDGVLAMIPKGYTGLPAVTDMYIRFAPGVNKQKVVERYRKLLNGNYDVLTPSRPGDLVNFGQVQNLPVLLAGLVAVLAVATLVHTLVTSIRRRRRDLAILKMLGFVPTQVRWAVAWQATTFVSAALLIGLPVGIAVGRLVWTAFTRQLGTAADPVTPSVRLLLTIPAAILLANLIAAIPAVIAGRMKPALALRAE
jgi:putative ABC transport system permease protein